MPRSRRAASTCSPSTTTRCSPRTSTTSERVVSHVSREALAAQTRRALVHPVFFGSAITGAGVDSLMAGIAELLPAADGDADGPVSGSVFKIERGPAGEKIAYVRMFSGTVRTRDRLRFGRDSERKVTAISVFDARHGRTARVGVAPERSASSGGSREIRIGDADRRRRGRELRAPVRPADAGDGRRPARSRRPGAASRRARTARRAGPADQRPPGRRAAGDLRLALRRGAEGSHRGDAGERLRHRRRVPRDDADLHRASVGTGEAVEILHAESNPFLATIGLASIRRRSARGSSSGSRSMRARLRSTSTRRLESFTEHMGEYVREALREGLFGWQVTDCIVTMTRCALQHPRRSAVETGTAEHGRRLPQAHAARADAGARAGAGRWSASRPSASASRSRRRRSGRSWLHWRGWRPPSRRGRCSGGWPRSRRSCQ